MWAARYGHGDVARHLLEARASPDARSTEGPGARKLRSGDVGSRDIFCLFFVFVEWDSSLVWPFLCPTSAISASKLPGCTTAVHRWFLKKFFQDFETLWYVQ